MKFVSTKRRALIFASLFSICGLFFLYQAQAQDIYFDLSSSKVQHIALPVSQSTTITFSTSIGELLIADPEIADAQPVTDKSIYVVGKALGTTTINVLSPEKVPVGLIEIVIGVDADDIRQAIRQVAPYANIEVGTVNGRVRLSGQISDPVTMEKVLQVVGQYGSDTVINALTLKGGQQVNLEVRILEASRDAGRDLGVSLRFGDIPSDVTRGGTDAGLPKDLDGNLLGQGPTGKQSFATFITNVITNGMNGFNLDIMINALESKGLVRKLAEPNLTTLSGEEARFLAGGEVPIRTLDKEGNVTLNYKEFGVRLRFTPFVLSDGRIQIRMSPEVSEILNLTSTGDPIFSTRNLDSTVELRDGQSFAVAGLLQASNVKQQEQVPWLGDVPVLGTLFRSSSFQKSETELVVIVTPRLVRPNVPGEPLSTPFDQARSSNDVEFFMLGQLEVTKDMIRSYEKGSDIIGPFGHIIDLGSEGMVYAKK